MHAECGNRLRAWSWSKPFVIYRFFRTVIEFMSPVNRVVEATKVATLYTHQGIESASALEAGHGPLNHLHAITHRIIPRFV